MTRSKKIMLSVGALIVAAAAGGGYYWFQRTDDPAVTVEVIRRRDLEAVVSASGTIQPKRSVNISASTMGVTRLAVEEGMRVSRGQFLLQIDPEPLRSAVVRSEAGVEAARAALRQAQAATETARAALDLAHTLTSANRSSGRSCSPPVKRSNARRTRWLSDRPSCAPANRRSPHGHNR